MRPIFLIQLANIFRDLARLARLASDSQPGQYPSVCLFGVVVGFGGGGSDAPTHAGVCTRRPEVSIGPLPKSLPPEPGAY